MHKVKIENFEMKSVSSRTSVIPMLFERNWFVGFIHLYFCSEETQLNIVFNSFLGTLQNLKCHAKIPKPVSNLDLADRVKNRPVTKRGIGDSSPPGKNVLDIV